MANEPSATPVLRDPELKTIIELVYRQSGITLNAGKRALIAARLQSRLRTLGLASYADYLRLLERDRSGDELVVLLDAIATNHTSFFREPRHFELLRELVVPFWRERGGAQPLAGWSIPCSSGEEPVTIAITLLEALAPAEQGRVALLGSDLSTKVLRAAERGVYGMERAKAVPPPLLRKYFERGQGAEDGLVRVAQGVRRLITYQRGNLLEIDDLGRRFEFIFCRNVMIYFDRRARQRAVTMLERHLAPGGYLFVGHVETLNDLHHALQRVAPAVLRRSRG
jgi:chemotaxis protein methyltransferase CheR